jgi:CRP/FNR family transcriptional regulator, cyclic AMP receptor protein
MANRSTREVSNPGPMEPLVQMSRVLLLDAYPELASTLEGEAAERARRSVVVDVERLEPGAWSPDRGEPQQGHLGLLILEGLMIRELSVAGSRSVEVLNRGDVLRPWQEDSASFCEASWRCLTDMRLAVLGPRAAAAICRWPPLVSAVVDRAMRRSRSLAVHAAIESIVGLERRLILLLWHFAEHWGRRTEAGVEVPIELTHEMLGQLVGARRPSVTAALSALEREGRIERRKAGGWILHGDPPGVDLEQPAATERPAAGPMEGVAGRSR